MLGDEIGKGAYGRVYKGLDLENGDFVAIKQVSLENIAQEDLNIIMVHRHFLANCLLKRKNIEVLIFTNFVCCHMYIVSANMHLWESICSVFLITQLLLLISFDIKLELQPVA